MKLVERLARDAGTERTSTAAAAASTLVRLGAQFVEQAIAAEPDGQVNMITSIAKTHVTYDVAIGYGDSQRVIWRRTVKFGNTAHNVAGGPAFQHAARDQDAVAWAALELQAHYRTTLVRPRRGGAPTAPCPHNPLVACVDCDLCQGRDCLRHPTHPKPPYINEAFCQCDADQRHGAFVMELGIAPGGIIK